MRQASHWLPPPEPQTGTTRRFGQQGRRLVGVVRLIVNHVIVGVIAACQLDLLELSRELCQHNGVKDNREVEM